MNSQVRRAHARAATLSLPADFVDGVQEKKYPAYVGLLIATGGSVLLWTAIGWVAASIF